MPPSSENKHKHSGSEKFNGGSSAELLLSSLAHDKSANATKRDMLHFYRAYNAKGFDLDGFYKKQPETQKREAIMDGFLKNKKYPISSSLAEQLPLFANTKGRLGPYIEARVTKTLRFDDQGNTFVDMVLELKNKWVETLGDEVDIPAKMTLLIDVSISDGTRIEDKEGILQSFFLDKAKRANVMCYESEYGELGITRPKLIVGKEKDYYEKVGNRLGNLINLTASDSFSISQPELFNQRYQEYFKDFISGLADNASRNAVYLQRKYPRSATHEKLADEYKKIANFLRVYEKTPTVPQS